MLYQVAAGHARLDNLAWLVRHPVYGAPQLDVPVVYDVVEVWGKEEDHSGFVWHTYGIMTAWHRLRHRPHSSCRTAPWATLT